MSLINNDLLFKILTFAIPVLFAITVHEAAHGYAARYFGDMTAASLGRITLNPIKHIDPIGTIIMPIALLVISSGTFAFGYAKPVPVNFSRLHNPKRDMLWVALAGPASNFAQALLWAMLFAVLIKFDINTPFFMTMASAGISINFVLCILNLFPIPPLDGGRILVSLLPYNLARPVAQTERYGIYIVFLLLALGVLWDYWIEPIAQIGYWILNWIVFLPILGRFLF